MSNIEKYTFTDISVKTLEATLQKKKQTQKKQTHKKPPKNWQVFEANLIIHNFKICMHAWKSSACVETYMGQTVLWHLTPPNSSG